MEYTIREKQNLQSQRDGYNIEVKSLSAAKRIASRQQMFAGTVLTIEDAWGLLSWKDGKGWHDTDVADADAFPGVDVEEA